MMSSEVRSLNRYNWLGNSLTAIISNIVTNPVQILKYVFIELNGYIYTLLLLVPYGVVLPIIGIEILLIGSADFAANMLSLNQLQRSINGYHSITLIPVIIVSAMIGLNRIRKIYSIKQCYRIILLTLASFVSLFIICIPHIFGNNSFWILSPFPSKDPALAEIKSLIPADAILSIQANIGPHFSQRYKIYAYPNKVSEADFIILRLEDIDESLKSKKLSFLHHMLLEPEDYLASVKCLLNSKKYGIFYFNAPWLVLTQKQNGHAETGPANINIFLETLEKQWIVDKTKTYLNECSGIT